MIGKRLLRIKKVILVLGGKGGVGKSVISAALAGILARNGMRVGLMDADIYGPSSVLISGAKSQPKEERDGLIPPVVGGVKVMSVDLFAPGEPVPLTGRAGIQMLVEMLALTDWGDLDFLVVDMPPATGDTMMTFTSLESEHLTALVVTMPDKLSIAVARRVLQLLRLEGISIAGVIGNMYPPGPVTGALSGPDRLAKEFHVRVIGRLPDDQGVRAAVEVGGISPLLKTAFARSLERSMKGTFL